MRFPALVLTVALCAVLPSAPAAADEALASAEVRRRMDEFGLSHDITDLAVCNEEVRAERERWAEYTRVAGILPE